MKLLILLIIITQVFLLIVCIGTSIYYQCKNYVKSSNYYQSTKETDNIELSNKICPICLEDFDSKNPKIYKFNVCSDYNHPFHKKCISNFIRYNSHFIQIKKCPICRKLLKSRSDISIV